MPVTLGARLGVYEVVALIGAGGMGEVYRARDPRLARDVAIKVLSAHVAADPQAHDRFEREARAVAALNHPHICAVYDVGSQDGINYLVMEFVEGETLAARLQKGPLSIERALEYGIHIASALDAAHRAGIVHRDLKPGNIMLVKSGAKLLDFGLATTSTPLALAGPNSRAGTIALTSPGMLIGTVQYMAPEQVEGRPVDARTDIFAFGVVLYEMVAGRKPFDAESPAGTIAAILERAPRPLASIQPSASPALDRVVATCLAKDPDDRWQSVRDLIRELQWLTAEHPAAVPIAPAGPGARWRRALPWVLMTIAGAIALILSGLVVQRDRQKPTAAESVQFVVMPPENATFSGDGFAGSNAPGPQLAMSPDGGALAFIASTADGRPRLWIRSFDNVVARAVPGTAGAAHPFWSPDGRSIGFFAGAKLKTTPASGGPVQVVCDVVTPRGGTWNQEGTIIFASGFGDSLYRVPAAGGLPSPLTRLDAARRELSHRWPEFLPDGRRFLYLVINAHSDRSGIYLGSLDSQETMRVLDTEFRATYVEPGNLLFVREGTLLAQPFDVSTSQLTGTARPVAEHVGSGQATGEALFSTSPSGLAYAASIGSPSTQLTWFDRGGQRLGTIGTSAEHENLALSPDSQHVAVHRVDAALGTDVWLIDAVQRNWSRFTFDSAMDFAPTWSPDGRRVAFTSNRSGTFELFEKLSSGAGQEESVINTGGNGAFVSSWSPDGRFLLYAAAGKTGFDLWVLPLAGERKPQLLFESIANEAQARFSPDGRWIAYTSDETGTAEIFVQPFPTTGAKWQVSSGGGADAQWRRDGRELFYLASDGTLMAEPVTGGSLTFDVGAAQRLFQTRVPTIRGPLFFGDYAPSADGRRFLVNTVDAQAPPIPMTIVLNWKARLQ